MNTWKSAGKFETFIMELNVRDKQLPIWIVSREKKIPKKRITLMINKRAASLLPKHGFMSVHLHSALLYVPQYFFYLFLINEIIISHSFDSLTQCFCILYNILVQIIFCIFRCYRARSLCFIATVIIFRKGAKSHNHNQIMTVLHECKKK